MNEIEVSVIVPVYNAEKFLSRTIEYLKNQTLKEIEIILVDDGSTDSSPLICDEACRSDGRIRCIHKANAGVSAARNDGIDVARGKYLMFCDADDIPNTNMAEVLLKRIKADNADIVLCGFKKQNETSYIDCNIPYSQVMTDQSEIIKKLIMPMIVWSYAPDKIALPDIYGSVWRGLYSKKLLIRHKIRFPMNITLGEDMVFNLTAFWYAKRISFVDTNLYTYIENQNSATHTNGMKMWNQYLDTWESTHKTIEKLSFVENDTSWHNFQLSRYAVSAILEGICPQAISKKQKQILVKDIISNPLLIQSLSKLPRNIPPKYKFICYVMKWQMFRIITAYYQHIYDKNQ